MGFEWLGGETDMERLRRLEAACGETGRELAQLQKRGIIGAGECDELSRRLAAIAVWVRASMISGMPQPPPDEVEAAVTHQEAP